MCKINTCTPSTPCHWCKRRNKKSTPIKRTPLKKKVYQIKRRSDKRAKEERMYNNEAKRYKEENSLCAAMLEGCTTTTDDIHHKTGRDNSRLLDKENWLPVCRNCHEWITKNSKQAIELGLSKRRIT